MKALRLFAVLVVLVAASCTRQSNVIRWSAQDIFNTWGYAHQDTSSVYSAYMQEDTLCLLTRAYTYDRTKMFSKETYGAGTYRWMTYIPVTGEGDQTTTGSWIYCDDHHEIDFEVGWGREESRAEAGCKPGQMVACMTNQDFPFTSSYVAIDPGWHEFGIRLDVEEGNYHIHWLIDGKERKEQKVGFGTDFVFHVMVSVENLLFIGSHIPEQDNVGRYLWVEYSE